VRYTYTCCHSCVHHSLHATLFRLPLTPAHTRARIRAPFTGAFRRTTHLCTSTEGTILPRHSSVRCGASTSCGRPGRESKCAGTCECHSSRQCSLYHLGCTGHHATLHHAAHISACSATGLSLAIMVTLHHAAHIRTCSAMGFTGYYVTLHHAAHISACCHWGSLRTTARATVAMHIISTCSVHVALPAQLVCALSNVVFLAPTNIHHCQHTPTQQPSLRTH
jgi:hypothetical protein